MSLTWFLVVFAVSAAAMAVWIDTRFPSLAPEDLRSALLRLIGVWVFVYLAIASVELVVDFFAPATRLTIVLTAGFALLTLGLLTAVWIIRVAQRMMGGSLR